MEQLCPVWFMSAKAQGKTGSTVLKNSGGKPVDWKVINEEKISWKGELYTYECK